MIVAAVRDGRWLTPERIRVYPRLFLAIFLAALLWVVFCPLGPRWSGADFVGFWVPAHLAASGHATAIYDQPLLATLQQAISGRSDSYIPWVYPPTFLLIILPLGLLPYMLAFVVYVAVGLIVYWVALRKLAGPQGLLLALAFPGVIICIGNGHAEFLLAGLLGGALLLLDRQHYVAGLLLGLCSVKPHLFLLVPVALLAGGCWRAILSAAIIVLLGTAISIAIFGVEVWRDFLVTASGLGGGIEHSGASYVTVLAKQQSAFAFGSRLGGPILAIIVQIATMTFAAWAVAITWAKKRPLEERALVLCCGTLLASPYLFDYDLVILAVPMALLARNGFAEGFRPWRKSLLGALWVLPALARTSSLYGALPVTVILLGLSVVIAVTSPGGSSAVRDSQAATPSRLF
jgi:alpha-1,2-mannosyltransferase